jgi:hypothetical protein
LGLQSLHLNDSSPQGLPVFYYRAQLYQNAANQKAFSSSKNESTGASKLFGEKNARAGKWRMPQQRLGRLQAFSETKLDDNLIQLPF